MARRFQDDVLLQLPHDASQTGLTSTTMCAWYRRQGTQSTSGIIAQKNVFSAGGSEVSIEHTGDGTLACRVRATGAVRAFSSSTLTASNNGEWHHVAGIWDGSAIQVYLDGVADGSSASLSGTTSGDSGICVIGDHESVSDKYVDGDICEVAWWNRNLSLAELNAVIQNGVYAVPKGLILYVPIDGNPTTETERIRNLTITHTGSPSKSSHAPVPIGMRRASPFVVPAVAGATAVSNTVTGAAESLLGLAAGVAGAAESLLGLQGAPAGAAEASQGIEGLATGAAEALLGLEAGQLGALESLLGLAGDVVGAAEATRNGLIDELVTIQRPQRSHIAVAVARRAHLAPVARYRSHVATAIPRRSRL